MANARRGEVEIRLAGKKHVMRPTFEALASIEDMTGRSLQVMGHAIQAGTIRASEISAVILCGIRAQNPDTDLTVADIGEAIMAEGGFAAVQQALVDFLADLLVFYSDGQDGAAARKKKQDEDTAAAATS
jgi:hypothetical protein